MAFGAFGLAIACLGTGYAALTTLLERRHRVHTRIRCTPPLIKARTAWRLGSNRRALTLCAWLTCRPTTGFFPQISHCFAMILSFLPRQNPKYSQRPQYWQGQRPV